MTANIHLLWLERSNVERGEAPPFVGDRHVHMWATLDYPCV